MVAQHSAVVACLVLALSQPLMAQGGGGGGGGGQSNGSSTPPAASAPLKKNSDRTDPLTFLLDRKKPLEMSKQTEDSLKYYRGEMRHMQDVVYKDLDKAAVKKENGQPPSAVVLLQLSTEASARVKDIQEAYRDRGRLLLTDVQRQKVDSMESIWKRTEDTSKPVTLPPNRRPPPR